MDVSALVATIFGGVLLFIGFVFWLITRFMRNHRMDRTTNGRVVAVTYDDNQFNQEQGQPEPANGAHVRMRVHVSSRSGYTRYCYRVYTYTVGASTYTRADGVQYSQNLAERAIGRDVTVYYDSSDPGHSSLGGGKAFVIVYRILFGLGLALLALAALLWLG